MISRDAKLPTLATVQARAVGDLYYPWEIYAQPEPQTPFGESDRLVPISVPEDLPFTPEEEDSGMGAWGLRGQIGSAPIRAFEGKKFPRFHTGHFLRRQGKVRIKKQLGIYPSGHIPGKGVFPRSLKKVPQLPTSFPELAGFEEVPVGSTNATGAAPPQQGWWGNLQSLLTTVGGAIMESQTQKTQREIAAAQAVTATAQAQAAQAGVTQVFYRNLPLLLAVGGGATLLFLYLRSQKKGR